MYTTSASCCPSQKSPFLTEFVLLDMYLYYCTSIYSICHCFVLIACCVT